MLRKVGLLGAVASAAAFTAPATLPLRASSNVASSARPLRAGAAAVEMVDAGAVAAAVPGLVALGVVLQNNAAAPAPAAAAPATSPTPADMPTIATARANFKVWNDALQTKDAKIVANLYVNDQLSFLPTVSPAHIKAGGATSSTEDYFIEFVKKNPFGTITDDSIQVYGNGDAYLHSGLYTFELGDAGARTPVEARFSYVWQKVNGTWKISHHHSSVRPAAPNMLDQARANFKRWNDALQTKNPQTVANMYVSDELSFLPTVSPQHIKAGGASSNTEDYFVEFVKKNPFGTITDDSVQVFNGGDAYLHSGLYTFELGPIDARTPVEARFSYVWKKVAGDWKISHHHSSVTPASAPSQEEMLATARTNFKTWNDALQTKDAKTVANLYVSDGLSFLPTVSPDHIKAGGATSNTEDYFIEFVKKNPFGTITDDSVEVFNNGASYLHSGMYTFELGDAGARTPVEARFSYVWKKDGDAWKISHHHSSVRPEGAAKAAAAQEKEAVAA